MSPGRKTIKLMPDPQCWPLWDEDGNNLDPLSLGVSKELTRELIQLAEAYERPVDWGDPANTHWEETNFKSFKAAFWSIAERLQEELGAAFDVRAVPPWPTE